MKNYSEFNGTNKQQIFGAAIGTKYLPTNNLFINVVKTKYYGR